MAEKKGAGVDVVCTNRKARHQYEILETFEAGLALVGTEVKSLRDKRCDLTGAYAAVEGGEVFLKGAEIAEYACASRMNHDPRRRRKLLLHRLEIRRIAARTREKGFTLVPLRVYFSQGKAKVEIALARGRKLYDRREAKAKREAEREMARAVGRRR